MVKKIVTKKFLLEKFLAFLCLDSFYCFFKNNQYFLFDIEACIWAFVWVIVPSKRMLALISVIFIETLNSSPWLMRNRNVVLCQFWLLLLPRMMDINR